MLGLHKRAFIALGAAALLAVAGLSTAVFAETPTPTPGTPAAQSTGPSQDYRQVFLSKLAAALGVDQTKLSDSTKQAGSETIDEAVQRGDLAPNRAEEMKQRIQQGEPGLFGAFGSRGGRVGGHGWFGGPRGMTGPKSEAVQQAIADKLGITVEGLRTELRSGKSLSALAQEKGVAEADLQAVVVSAVKAQLDQAVKDGKLTQQQADSMLQRIQEAPLTGFGGKPRR